jgi:hypothetical protein
METNQMNKEVEIGGLPFTWRDVLRAYEPGDERKYPTPSPTMVTTVRNAIFRYQNDTGTQFTTNVDEEGYIHIKRIK